MCPRLQCLKTFPFREIEARTWPFPYAKIIGVQINVKLAISGASYEMFRYESYLVSIDDIVFISVCAQSVPHCCSVFSFRHETLDLDLAEPITIVDNSRGY